MPYLNKLRSPFILLSLLTLVLCGSRVAPSRAQSAAPERELEDKIPKHLPLKIEVRNLQNEHFMRDLEVEITNTGEKPIYYLDIALTLPEVIGPGGRMEGYVLSFGSLRMHEFENRPEPDDAAIQPGASYVLRLPERQWKGWELAKVKYGWLNPMKARLQFIRLHYGDGTGFLGRNGARVPVRADDPNLKRN